MKQRVWSTIKFQDTITIYEIVLDEGAASRELRQKLQRAKDEKGKEEVATKLAAAAQIAAHEEFGYIVWPFVKFSYFSHNIILLLLLLRYSLSSFHPARVTVLLFKH